MGNEIHTDAKVEQQIGDIDSLEFDDLLNLVSKEVDHQYSENNDNTIHKKNVGYYMCARELGRGVSSRVYLAKNCKNNKYYALKELRKNKNSSVNQFLFKKEKNLLKRLHHPNIIRCCQSFINKKGYYLATEYCSGGTLIDKIVSKNSYHDRPNQLRKRIGLSERESVNITKSILESVQYLHSNHIVHRDLKCSNIVFDKPNPNEQTIKLIDFGCAEVINNPDLRDSSEAVGTIHYAAPEIIDTNSIRMKSDLFACDMWSIGVICFLLVTGQFPFNGENDSDIYLKIKNGKYEWPEHVTVSDSCKHFIDSLLTINTVNRMSAKKALMHDWIVNMDEYMDNLSPIVNENEKYKDFDQLLGQISI